MRLLPHLAVLSLVGSLAACGSDSVSPADDDDSVQSGSSSSSSSSSSGAPEQPIADAAPDAAPDASADCVPAARTITPPAGDVVLARFASATKLIYSATDSSGTEAVHKLYAQDLCSSAPATELAVLDRPRFALDADGTPIVYVVGQGSYYLARLEDGTPSAVASDCTFSGFEAIDVVGSTAIVTDPDLVRVAQIDLDSPACDETPINEQDAAFPLGAGQAAAPARLGPDGTRALMAGKPLGTGPTCDGADEGLDYDDNDFLLYDVASETRSMVDFTPAAPAPECVEASAFGWYADARHVLVSGATFASLDTQTGQLTELTIDTAISQRATWLDVAPDGTAVVVVTGLGAYVSPL